MYVQSGELATEERSVDALLLQLDTKKAELEMNMHTNAGVVETYRKRQAEVCSASTSWGPELMDRATVRSLLSQARSRVKKRRRRS